MASNNPTFELGFLVDLQNMSEMIETSEASDASKDKQLSESATKENNHFANLSERDLEKLLEDKQSKEDQEKHYLVCFHIQGRVSNLNSYFLINLTWWKIIKWNVATWHDTQWTKTIGFNSPILSQIQLLFWQ